MPKVVITAEVEDFEKWEAGFRTHGELFKKQTVTTPIQFTATDKNQVLIVFEPDDLETYLQILDSPATAEAMNFDGVKRETVKVVPLDKEFDPFDAQPFFSDRYDEEILGLDARIGDYLDELA